MDTKNIQLLKRTFRKIEPIAQQTGELFYGHLFEVDPSIRPLFKGDMTAQAKMLMTVIGLTIQSLDQLEKVMPELEAIGRRHIGYGTMPADFDKFGGSLVWAFQQSLGDEWTAEVQTAWIEAFDFIRKNMKQAVR